MVTATKLDGVSMSTKEARERAAKKYESEKVERVMLRVPKGKRDIIQSHTESTGESVNAFINRARDETMARDNKNN